MPKKNRYSGVLQPRPVGAGSPEIAVILMYDIEEDKLRTRAAGICLDYGLQRIQFSAFFGKLNRNKRQELGLRLQSAMGGESCRIRLVPVCEQDLREMWVLEQYRQDADELAEKVGKKPLPRLKILGAEEA